MAQVAFSVRMDGNLKEEFEALCEALGMNMTTAFNIFARTAVREQRIPFEISAAKNADVNYSVPRGWIRHMAEPKVAYLSKSGSQRVVDSSDVLAALFELADKMRLSSKGKKWTREEINER